jgi:putative peptidoglycan lipid II flippase
VLRPSHSHSAYTASILLAASSFLSNIIGLVRSKYVAHVFGASAQTDAYFAAFRLPDLMNNFLVGGAVSITFVTLLNHYREKGEEAEGERLIFTVLNLMTLVLTAATVILMALAKPLIQRFIAPHFSPAELELCAHMTRILLPAQIFLFAGSVLGATLLVRKQFWFQSFQPIVYNLCIIAGGVFLHYRLGISSLAIGATCGFLFGSFFINAYGAYRAGVRYRLAFDWKHPGLKIWLRMALPLMFGFGLPFLDQFFVSNYASGSSGEITLLSNAKQLFSAPMAMLATAAGVASLPFFSQLWVKGKRYEFAMGAADSVSRVVGLGLLATSAIVPLAHPIVGLFFGGGRFTPVDVDKTAFYLTLYTLSLVFWSAQAIYARSFYAAGITWLPMLASTIILVIAFPLYSFGFHHYGAAGLALASDVGIGLQAIVLGLLLHRHRMVSLASLDYAEMGRCLLAGVVSGLVTWAVCIELLGRLMLLAGPRLLLHARLIDLGVLIAGTLLWMVVAKWVLEIAGSALPRVMMKRVKLR